MAQFAGDSTTALYSVNPALPRSGNAACDAAGQRSVQPFMNSLRARCGKQLPLLTVENIECRKTISWFRKACNYASDAPASQIAVAGLELSRLKPASDSFEMTSAVANTPPKEHAFRKYRQ
jgi:hypothetical protein